MSVLVTLSAKQQSYVDSSRGRERFNSIGGEELKAIRFREVGFCVYARMGNGEKLRIFFGVFRVLRRLRH